MEYSIGDLHGDYIKLFSFIVHTLNINKVKSKLLYNKKIICEFNYDNELNNYEIKSFIDNFEYNKEVILNLNFDFIINDILYNFDNNNNKYILLGDIFDCFIFTDDIEYKQIKQELTKKIFLFGGPFSYKSYSLKNINQEDFLNDNYYTNIKIKYQTLTVLLIKYLKNKLKKNLILILGNHEITYYGLYSKDLRNFISDNFILYYKSNFSNYIYTHGVANKSILNIINFQLNNKYFHSISKTNDYFNKIINIKNSITLLDKSTNEFNCLTILDYLINYVKDNDYKLKNLTLIYNLGTNYNVLLLLNDEFKNLSLKSTFSELSKITKLFTRTTLFNYHTKKIFNKILKKLINDNYRIFNDNDLYKKISKLIFLVHKIKKKFYNFINIIFPYKEIINPKNNKIICQNINNLKICDVYYNLDKFILKNEYYISIKKLFDILQPNYLIKIHNYIKEIINIYENYINFHLYFQSNLLSFIQYYKINNIDKNINDLTKNKILEYINNNEIKNIYPLQICGHKYIEKSKINYDKVKIFCMDKSLSSLYNENYNLINTEYLLYYGIMFNNNFTIFNINNKNINNTNINNTNNNNTYKLYIEKYNI